MKVWLSHSSEKSKCRACNKKTNQSKVYEQREIKIYIPLCDDCHLEVDIKPIALNSINLIRKEVSNTWFKD